MSGIVDGAKLEEANKGFRKVGAPKGKATKPSKPTKPRRSSKPR